MWLNTIQGWRGLGWGARAGLLLPGGIRHPAHVCFICALGGLHLPGQFNVLQIAGVIGGVGVGILPALPSAARLFIAVAAVSLLVALQPPPFSFLASARWSAPYAFVTNRNLPSASDDHSCRQTSSLV